MAIPTQFYWRGSPSVIVSLRNELKNIISYFENSKSAPGMEIHRSISLDRVIKYIQSVLDEHIEAKLTNLSNQPSEDGVLNTYRSLVIDPTSNLPLPRLGMINFLFTASWILQDTPKLSDFHERLKNSLRVGKHESSNT